MTTTKQDRADIRGLDATELDRVSGGSIFDIAIDVFQQTITSPRDAASGLPTGKRMHKPIIV